MTPRGRVSLRTAKDTEARTLHALIAASREEGHLLPRTLDELEQRQSVVGYSF